MEQERNSGKYPEQPNELRTIGYKAAETLRGYGYDDLADRYDQALRRTALDSKEVLAHSRIASSTLKELNKLAASKQGRHPALDRNIQLQQQLETTLEKEAEVRLDKAKSISELSFPAKLYLEENSKSLANAAQEVTNYLDRRRQYSHPKEGKTPLQRNLDTQLQSYRSLPTSQNMERLEQYIQQSIKVMKQDYETAKATLQQENEQYVAGRNYLSPEGRTLILNEAEKGEFEIPNRVSGNIVLSRANYAQEQLDQYRQVKETIFSLEQRQNETDALSKSTSENNYSYLSTEQQQQYAHLTQNITLTTERSNEMER